MGLPTVAAFTDTYLPTVNGVTYTVRTWRRHWEDRGGSMAVVYPESSYSPESGEHPVGSLPLPVYSGFRVGAPRIPDGVGEPDVVHAHTPFGVGLGGVRLARSASVPLVASFHTPTAEYARYLTGATPFERVVRDTAARYEGWFLDRADHVVVPTETTAAHVRSRLRNGTPVSVVSNGVDVTQFEPTDGVDFRHRHGLPPDRPLVGYTGRHGHEKNLELLVEAVSALERDVTLVLAGDGPARGKVESRAETQDVALHTLGFLDREELPAFYSTLDAFGFPSPVETQGLVALEAMACGTPVAGLDAGALTETIDDGETGYTATDSPAAFADALARVLDERERLSANCLARREVLSVEHSLDALATIYESLAG